MKASLFFSLVITVTLFSCKPAPSEGSLQDGVFKNERFGWTLEIPEGWHTITNLEQDLLKKQGHKATTEAFDDRAIDNWTQILHLSKGLEMNRLIVSYLKYKPELHGDYEQSKETRFRGTKYTLEQNPGVNIKVIRTITPIDEVVFDTYNMQIFKNGSIVGYQTMLEKKYKNNDVLLIGVVTEKLEPFFELQDAIMASTFSRKE